MQRIDVTHSDIKMLIKIFAGFTVTKCACDGKSSANKQREALV